MSGALNPSAKRDKKLSGNANAYELKRFKDACRVAKLKPGPTIRALAEALVEQVAAHGSVTHPLRIEGSGGKRSG